MNNIVLARSNIKQAIDRLRYAEEVLSRGNYPFVVRLCQEAVELSLKAALRLVGIEPPKWHDVGPILKRERGKFPEEFRKYIDKLASISRSLRKERELAMYGDEVAGVAPEELYTRDDAVEYFEKAKLVVTKVIELYEELLGEKPA
ncbi:MAG: DNA-binding protein [Thermoprotei archaeon]|nr:MAG: DNA-binding protein [Thermoprotei archaeon]